VNAGLTFPVIFQAIGDVDQMVNQLCNGYLETYSERPSIEQMAAWKGSLHAIKSAGISYPLMAEFPIFNLERADFLVVGKRKVLTIEAKGWKTISKVNDYSVIADGKQEQDPCYQLNNYVSKLRYFHSASAKFDFDGALLTYNNATYHDSCNVLVTAKQLGEIVSTLGGPAEASDLSEIINGKFVINKTLVDLIKESKEELLDKAALVLLSKGYGLTAEQSSLLENVLTSLEKGERRVFLVKGESGSGKTLVAITLLLEAVSRGYKALLGYRNNRLLNTLRSLFSIKRGTVNLSTLIQFYSTGAQGRYRGIGEQNFPVDKYGELDLAVFDEAQRMTESVAGLSMTRAKVSVYFYDELQILTGKEEGTRDCFLKYAPSAEEGRLSALFRAPASYLRFVEGLLNGKESAPRKYSFNVLEDARDLLRTLREKKAEGSRVALVSAFTESEGDKDPDSPKNVRIGYPLQSGFDLYKGLDTEVRWLMNEKTQYPRYWMGLIDPLKFCASVYGAQGFESDYVGVVWGRDFVRRGSGWRINPHVITDRVGGRYSLRSVAEKDPSKAERLLKNRYYIMLTRGIRGTYVFFEDLETKEFVKRTISSPS
jgi:DUF2075 family protein